MRLRELTQHILGDARPKPFCRFFRGKSLLVRTEERISPTFRADRALFALAWAHKPFYQGRKQPAWPETSQSISRA
jgi:hypothetical protein